MNINDLSLYNSPKVFLMLEKHYEQDFQSYSTILIPEDLTDHDVITMLFLLIYLSETARLPHKNISQHSLMFFLLCFHMQPSEHGCMKWLEMWTNKVGSLRLWMDIGLWLSHAVHSTVVA